MVRVFINYYDQDSFSRTVDLSQFPAKTAWGKRRQLRKALKWQYPFAKIHIYKEHFPKPELVFAIEG